MIPVDTVQNGIVEPQYIFGTRFVIVPLAFSSNGKLSQPNPALGHSSDRVAF